MKHTLLLFLFLSFILVGCSDKSDEPTTADNKLVGYWAITHIQTIEHIGEVHTTTDKDVPPHGLDSYPSEENYRYDVLIFDEDLVTVRGDLPNKPKSFDYDMDSSDDMLRYNSDLENWYQSIALHTDQFACPVGSYSIEGNNLIIGSLNMGAINFVSDNVFTLDYKKSLVGKDDYRRLVYTYTRIYSLLL